jgi:LPPG:FO 2-phospho-L-lactate transferase
MDPSVAVLAGGVGAARFLAGLSRAVDPTRTTAIVNTADDTVLHGLTVCPDLDTVTYTLAGLSDDERGWGLSGETWRTLEALARFADVRPAGSTAGSTWFSLGDTDLATHLYRTARLAEGATLHAVTDEIRRAFGVAQRIVPMTNEPVRTIVTLADDSPVSPGADMSFQEWFVRHRHAPPVAKVAFVGADGAVPLALDHVASADVVVIAPSNPLVSIGPIRALSGVDAALAARRDTVVAVSPIVGGRALKGPAAEMMRRLGSEASVVGVARLYAGICSTLVIDSVDADLAPEVEAAGMACVVTDTVMSDADVALALALTTIGAVA